MGMARMRTHKQKMIDCLSFPFRAVSLFEKDWRCFSSLATERFDYVIREVTGFCLDVGCGRHNRFIEEYCHGFGKGIDVFPYAGLTAEHLISDMRQFPFSDAAFDTVTFIASINHAPQSARDAELREAHRVLRPGGVIVITMGNPCAEILVHKLVFIYDRLFKTHYDVDSERGMDEEENYYLTDHEIISRLRKAGFTRIVKKYFLTQWFLNHLFVGYKK